MSDTRSAWETAEKNLELTRGRKTFSEHDVSVRRTAFKNHGKREKQRN